MPNPNPQHNPTDGLGIAAFVQVAGTGVTANLTVAANRPNPGNYKLTLSVSASGFPATCQLTASLVDVSNAAYTPSGSFTYKSYNTAQATVSGSGLITSVAAGQAIIEVQFPTFDSTTGIITGMEYTQIVVQVIP